MMVVSHVQEKTYYIYEEDGEPMLHRAEGTKIDWAAGKNPTVKVLPPLPSSVCHLGLAFALCSLLCRAVLLCEEPAKPQAPHKTVSKAGSTLGSATPGML